MHELEFDPASPTMKYMGEWLAGYGARMGDTFSMLRCTAGFGKFVVMPLAMLYTCVAMKDCPGIEGVPLAGRSLADAISEARSIVGSGICSGCLRRNIDC